MNRTRLLFFTLLRCRGPGLFDTNSYAAFCQSWGSASRRAHTATSEEPLRNLWNCHCCGCRRDDNPVEHRGVCAWAHPVHGLLPRHRSCHSTRWPGKPVALVCHAPGALRHVKTPAGKPLVEGKNVTGFTDGEEGSWPDQGRPLPRRRRVARPRRHLLQGQELGRPCRHRRVANHRPEPGFVRTHRQGPDQRPKDQIGGPNNSRGGRWRLSFEILLLLQRINSKTPALVAAVGGRSRSPDRRCRAQASPVPPALSGRDQAQDVIASMAADPGARCGANVQWIPQFCQMGFRCNITPVGADGAR